MVYADYPYYTEKYFGTLPENSFYSLILKASKEIDKNVNTRITQEIIEHLPKEAQEQLQYTACALIDLICRKQEDNNRKVTSISIDGVSKTYTSISKEEYAKSKREILDNLPIELTRYE